MEGRDVKTLRYSFQNKFFLNQEIARQPNDQRKPGDGMDIWLRLGRNMLSSTGK